ncbi:MAG: hypothetical protein K6T88_05275 [Bacillus sp. (in: Bacteria)]|nr:hypothetical protein [Bacillus sp. (in: firmicutes)]
MYSSKSESYSAVDANICENCRSATITHEETATTKGTGITYIVLGWLFFAISLLFVPIIFGAGAFLMGILTFNGRSQTHGVILMFFAAVSFILGSLYSFMVAGTMFI